MNTILILLAAAALCVLAAVVAKPSLFQKLEAWQNRNRTLADNVGEGTRRQLVRTAGAAITAHHLLLKVTSATACNICGASDVPVGTAAHQQAGLSANGDSVAIELLNTGGTHLMVASEAITINSPIYTAANGKVQDLPGSSGTYYQVGWAITAAGADGDLIEVQTVAPIKTVVA